MRYLVGLLTGGLMEQPKFELEEPFQIIIANSEKEAVELYNKANNCSYYYGHCLGKATPDGTCYLTSEFVSKYDFENLCRKLKMDKPFSDSLNPDEEFLYIKKALTGKVFYQKDSDGNETQVEGTIKEVISKGKNSFEIIYQSEDKDYSNVIYNQVAGVSDRMVSINQLNRFTHVDRAFKNGASSDEMRKMIANTILYMFKDGHRILCHKMVSFEKTDYALLEPDKLRLSDIKMIRDDEGITFNGPYNMPFLLEIEI